MFSIFLNFNFLKNTLDWCSHFTAIRYYTETIKNEPVFPAQLCSSWDDFTSGVCNKNPINYMGFNASSQIRGDFFVKIVSNQNYDGIELFDFVMSRVAALINDILRLDFHIL